LQLKALQNFAENTETRKAHLDGRNQQKLELLLIPKGPKTMRGTIGSLDKFL
jgi:hypothetical protein